jgi:hypothetical protein
VKQAHCAILPICSWIVESHGRNAIDVLV